MNVDLPCDTAMVVAEAPAEPRGGSVTVYPASFFGDRQPISAWDMLQYLPGFTVDTGSTARGLIDAAGNVVINGARPITKNDTLEDVLRRIPAASVQAIEVVRGNSPNFDMQGKSMIANILRRTSAGKLTRTTARFGVAENGRVAWLGQLDFNRCLAGISLESSFAYSKLIDDAVGDGTWRRVLASGQESFSANENGNAGTNGQIKASLNLGFHGLGGTFHLGGTYLSKPYRSRISDYFPALGDSQIEVATDRRKIGELNLRYDRKFTGGYSLEFSSLARNGNIDLTDAVTGTEALTALTGNAASSAFTNNRTTRERIVQLRVHGPLGPFTMHIGGEADWNALHSNTLYSEDGVDIPIPAANVEVTEARRELSVEGEIAPLKGLRILSGVRFENSTIRSRGNVIGSRTYSFIKPRLFLGYALSPTIDLRFTAERQVSQIDFDDFVSQAASFGTGEIRSGNPTLRPYSDAVILAEVERKFGKDGSLILSYSRIWRGDTIDREIIESAAGVLDQPGNIGSGDLTIWGATASFPLAALGLRDARLSGSFKHRQSSVVDPITKVLRPITNVVPTEWEVHFVDRIKRFNATWGIDVIGAVRHDEYRSTEIAESVSGLFVGAYAEFSLSRRDVLRFDLFNIGNVKADYDRRAWVGLRRAGREDYIDEHSTDFGMIARLQFTRTF